MALDDVVNIEDLHRMAKTAAKDRLRLYRGRG